MANKPIEILINAKDNASAVIDAINGKLKSVAAAIATYFGVQSFANVVRSAADFEEGLSRIQAATDSSKEEMIAFRIAAEQAGSTTKFTAVEAATALENLAKSGLESKDAIAALPAVLNLAQAGGVGLADASDYLTKVVRGMGLQFSESARVADVLAMGANASSTSVKGLADAMSYAAPTANVVGLSLESTVAIIGQFANAGIDASRAGTALNSVLTQFSDPTSKFKEALSALGITTTDFDKALHQLADSGVKGAGAIRSVGLEAGPALQAAIGLGMPALDGIKAKLLAAGGSAESVAKVMGDNLHGAMQGLGSAWDGVKIALGTPVLPVLKSGIDELAAAINAAVTNGTITRFGEALATAFQSAITWVRAFAAEIDFKKTAADLQAFAVNAGDVFSQIGKYSTNAGNIVKTAYGVMSAGTNVVLTAIYGLGAVWATQLAAIQSGVATILTAFAKITPGTISKGFKEAADEIKLSADATAAAAKSLAEKAKQSFDDVADGAKLAREGAAGLAEQMGKTSAATEGIAPSAKAATDAIDILYQATIKEAAEAIEAAGKIKAVQDATENKTKADKDAKEAIEKLREEYKALAQSGDFEGAIKKLGEVEKALEGIGKEAKKSPEMAKEAAKELETAYAQLGVASNTALKHIADGAKTNYEIIKNSGVASTRELSEAFASYAEKSIAANNGVASAAIKTEATMRGYKVEVDETGKASLKLVTVTNDVAESFAKAGEALKAKSAAAKSESWQPGLFWQWRIAHRPRLMPAAMQLR